MESSHRSLFLHYFIRSAAAFANSNAAHLVAWNGRYPNLIERLSVRFQCTSDLIVKVNRHFMPLHSIVPRSVS
jgi:hypothetical protein